MVVDWAIVVQRGRKTCCRSFAFCFFFAISSPQPRLGRLYLIRAIELSEGVVVEGARTLCGARGIPYRGAHIASSERFILSDSRLYLFTIWLLSPPPAFRRVNFGPRFSGDRLGSASTTQGNFDGLWIVIAVWLRVLDADFSHGSSKSRHRADWLGYNSFCYMHSRRKRTRFAKGQ